MPHQCVRCSRVYEAGSNAVLKGCVCGGKFFFFVKKVEDVPAVQHLTEELSEEQRKEIEEVVVESIVKQERVVEKEIVPEVELSSQDKKDIEKDTLDLADSSIIEKPVILDLESIRVMKPGKFEIDLTDIFKGKPVVYRLEEGKYVVDVASVFRSEKENK